MNELELTGRARTHVTQHDELRFAMTPRALDAFLAMRADAAKAGLQLAPFSSFRDFPAQTRIWNRKFRGEATLFDPSGTALAFASLSRPQVIDAILAWSALPGASRHHWGTDVDVYDASRVMERGEVELLPAETAPGGPFHDLFVWLSAEMGRYGFFRPYDVFRGGFNVEAWHLSFAEESAPALRTLSVEVLERALRAEQAIDGLEDLVPMLPEVVTRYVQNVAPSPAGAMA